MKHDYGLKIGTVKRNAGGSGKSMAPNCVTVSIQDGLNRIKDVTARVLSSFAGNDFGSVIIPQDGEQVLIGYLNGNSDGEAYILGSVFQGKINPPYDISKTKVPDDTKPGESMVIKLKNKTQISVNNVSDKDTSITITTGTNSRVIQLIDKSDNSFIQIADKVNSPETYMKIDFAKGEIECKAKTKMSFTVGENKGSMVLDGNSGNISVNSQGNINLDSKKNITLNSTSGSTLSCGSNKFAAGTANAEINGAQINVKGSGPVAVKGATVQLG
ncbi:MAG: phage baseplate assembly protein V [Acutalibacteraceae bacterium]